MLAQMLDNDEDGCADDALVVNKMRKNRSGMALFQSAEQAESLSEQMVKKGFFAQWLFENETEPTCSGKDETGSCRDAAIEEIFHVVSSQGLSAAYPDTFGECNLSDNNFNTKSAMQVEMDKARGGYFVNVPNNYPDDAIYHYDDKTCEYNCQGTEFIYWALTSILGGQDKRRDDNMEEWEASTKSLVSNKLKGMYKLVTDGKITSMKLLTTGGVLPGAGGQGAHKTYRPTSQTCQGGGSGCSLSGAGCGPLGNSDDEQFGSCDNGNIADDDGGGPEPPPVASPTPKPPVPSPVASPTPKPPVPSPVTSPTPKPPVPSPVASPTRVTNRSDCDGQGDCPDGMTKLEVEMRTDEYGNDDNYWFVKKGKRKVLNVKKNSLNRYKSYEWCSCLPKGRYKFIVKDLGGDGFYSPGYLKLWWNGKLKMNLAKWAGEWESKKRNLRAK